MTTFRYAKWRQVLFLFFAPILFLFGFWAAASQTGMNFLAGLLIMAMAAIWFVQLILALINSKPAVALSADGIAAQRLGGKTIPWDQISGVHLRWTKRKAMFVVPLNTPELALEIHPDQPYWRSGGFGRTVMRWLSRASDDHFVLVNLNGLAGGKPERIMEAVRALRPQLVREIENRTATGE
jgi:hypothetical protein